MSGEQEAAIPEQPFEILAWQQRVLDIIEKAREEGRTEVRYVHGRRGSFLAFVAPDSGSTAPGRELG